MRRHDINKELTKTKTKTFWDIILRAIHMAWSEEIYKDIRNYYDVIFYFMSLKWNWHSSRCGRIQNFLFGTELCKLFKIGRWWLWGGGGKKRRACVIVRTFFISYFSDKINQIGVLYLKNFHFSLIIFKNGVKRSKPPILHDSPSWLDTKKDNLFVLISLLGRLLPPLGILSWENLWQLLIPEKTHSHGWKSLVESFSIGSWPLLGETVSGRTQSICL